MSDGDALLRAILERPAEDTPRLVYADFIEERGEEERAAYIRDRVANPQKVEGFIGGHDASGWFPSTHECGPDSSFRLRRGFIFEASMPLAAFMRHAEALFHSHPIERVTLIDREPLQARQPGQCAWFRDMRPGESSRPWAMYCLPVPIFDRLRRGELEHGISGQVPFQRYKGNSEARADLSDACVAYGRSLAGLSPTVPA